MDVDSADDVPHFVAFGGVWIDEIRKQDQPALEDVLGGTVTWATLGARVMSRDDARRIAMAPRVGNGFPDAATDTFKDWNVNLHMLPENDKPTPRGVVDYHDPVDASKRTYTRTTEPLHLEPDHLANSPFILASAVHFFDTPSVISEQVPSLLHHRTRRLATHPNRQNQNQNQHQNHANLCNDDNPPLVIWEPQAKTCSPATLASHLRAATLVTVFSPNHAELGRLFGDDALAETDGDAIERYAAEFLRSGVGPAGDRCVVVRAAGRGCLVLSRRVREGRAVWLPAVLDAEAGLGERVVDPTGAGNAFLGGMAVGLVVGGGDFVEAAVYGSVAASFAIEQVGLPRLERGEDGRGETWNGDSVAERLGRYRERLGGVAGEGR